jgi:hypothetical protein
MLIPGLRLPAKNVLPRLTRQRRRRKRAVEYNPFSCVLRATRVLVQLMHIADAFNAPKVVGVGSWH